MPITRSARIAALSASLPNLYGDDHAAALALLGKLCAAANLASIRRPATRIVGGAR